MKPIATFLLLILSIAPVYVRASIWPDGETRVPGLSFALIRLDASGRYVAQLPSGNVEGIKSTCGTGRPLWLYGSLKPGKCLTVMPQRDVEGRITELQVTFASADDNKIWLLSTHDINRETPSLRDHRDDELAAIANRFPGVLKDKFNGRIKALDTGAAETFFFVPLEKLVDSTDDPSGPPCTRWKTMVVRRNARGLSQVGYLDNTPSGVVSIQADTAPLVLTDRFCKTTATLWKVSPKVEPMASFFNGVGG